MKEISDVDSIMVFSNSKSMFSKRGFICMLKEGISFSLALYKYVYCWLNTQLHVGLFVCAANLMKYCIESFCLRRLRGRQRGNGKRQSL